jgi:hypothetical protein
MNWGYCASGFDGYWGEGNGASGGGTSASGEACIGGGDGIVPADDSAPGALINDTTEYGHGGGVFLNTWPDFNPGNGANVYYVDETSDLTADTTGYDGYVKFVYTATSSSGGGSVNNKDALAPTGVEYPFGVFAALGAAVVTAGVTLIGRTRRATASKRSN